MFLLPLPLLLLVLLDGMRTKLDDVPCHVDSLHAVGIKDGNGDDICIWVLAGE